MKHLLSLLLILLLSAPAWGEPDNVDARFDKTGDGLVDASDWHGMSADERMAYARESLLSLGEDPDVLIEGEETRASRYLKGLEAVYAR